MVPLVVSPASLSGRRCESDGVQEESEQRPLSSKRENSQFVLDALQLAGVGLGNVGEVDIELGATLCRDASSVLYSRDQGGK